MIGEVPDEEDRIGDVRGRKSEEIVSTAVTLPRYTEALFNEKITDLTPDYDRSDGQVAGGSKKTLDAINKWWREIKMNLNGLDRFKSALTLFGIPGLESRQARAEYNAIQHNSNQIVWGIDLLLHSTKTSWDKVSEIGGKVSSWEELKGRDDQTMALCEALNETGSLNIPETEMRQKIAQYAWDELMAMFPYAKVQDRVLTTQDDLETDKKELIEAIGGPFWDKVDRHKAGVDFRTYMGQIKKGEFELPLRRAFRSLHECTKGNIPQNKSAIDILEMQEEILKGLYDEDAFDLED